MQLDPIEYLNSLHVPSKMPYLSFVPQWSASDSRKASSDPFDNPPSFFSTQQNWNPLAEKAYTPEVKYFTGLGGPIVLD